ncbi:ubiquitin fusion degradation protein [Drechmeria coniospora]|uniref:Ubiquitin fusion degradation protein n=1 Tax=Drechmeria coniospora TaxID=98403 RepID=A0A151GHF9_DRECN|nr:ubiquitin fusion degradation protein [Drechmeria coniospora]KYK56555.1 ubiquitin fusion degradation protein [Drechmeria coniospora]
MDDLPALRWSAAYTALHPTLTSIKNLSGDKIILPPSALEQLLAAAPSRRPTGAAFGSVDPFGAHDGGLHGGPRENGEQLPHPLMFRLVNPANGNVVHAGIREFSAPEGTLGLSPFLMEALAVDPKHLATAAESAESAVDRPTEDAVPLPLRITVHAQQLPKGTYVRLRPLEAGYDPDDWKSLLERHLRLHFTSLTKDAVLAVQGVRGETFKFLVDRFAPAGDGICVVDTDLEVDIEPLDEEQARESLRRIASRAHAASSRGSSQGGELSIWKEVGGRVAPGDHVDFTLPSWDRARPLVVALGGAQGHGLDLFVSPKSSRQRVPPRESNHVFGDFGPSEGGIKSIAVSPTDAAMDGAEAIMVSVYAPAERMPSSDAVPFTLRARAAAAAADDDDDERAADGSTSVEGQGHGADAERCENCLQWVPGRTMVLHESFCRRNNVACADCRAVFRKGSAEWEAHWHCGQDEACGDDAAGKARHDQVFHTHHRCPACDVVAPSLPDLARHRTTVCPGKLILCRFCHLEVPQEGDPLRPAAEVTLSGMTAHELADGARTTECHLCDRIVRLRDMETHLKHHDLDKVGRAKPDTCRNPLCGRTRHGVGPKGRVGVGVGAAGQGPANDVGLCSVCFGPLYVSMHDPDGRALARRMERRYLQQLMTGCGKAHCANERCRTGRANAGLEPLASEAKAALPEARRLLADVDGEAAPLYFCVDEANQQRRRAAESVAADKVWELAWCVAAAEAERGNVARMREWLQAWAPRR